MKTVLLKVRFSGENQAVHPHQEKVPKISDVGTNHKSQGLIARENRMST